MGLLIILLQLMSGVFAPQLPASGIRMDGVRVSPAASAGFMMETGIWDFSECAVAGKASLRMTCRGDSLLRETYPAVRTDFRLMRGSVALHRMEGRDWFISLDPAAAVAPGFNGHIQGTYRRYQQKEETVDGYISIHHTGGHTAILSAGDTLRDIHALDITLALSLPGNMDDSISAAQPSRCHRVRIVRLYDLESALPVAVSMESDYEGRLGDANTTYVFPLSEHPKQIASPPKAYQRNSRPVSSRVNDRTKNQDMSLPAEAIDITAGRGAVTVNLSGDMLPADLAAYDITGRLLAFQRTSDSVSTIEGLPAGECIITVYVAGKATPAAVRKLIILPQ